MFTFLEHTEELLKKDPIPVHQKLLIPPEVERICAGEYTKDDPFGVEVSKAPFLVEQNEKMHYIRLDGSFVTQTQYDNAKPFSDSLAAVYNGQNWCYIDDSGNTKTTFSTHILEAEPFSFGIAAIAVQVDSFFMDRKGSDMILHITTN